MNENKTPDEILEEEGEKIILTDEDGNELEFELIDSAVLKGNQYFACIPADAKDSEYLEYVILKLTVEDGEEFLVSVDDDDEFDDVADYFDDRLADEVDLDAE